MAPLQSEMKNVLEKPCVVENEVSVNNLTDAILQNVLNSSDTANTSMEYYLETNTSSLPIDTDNDLFSDEEMRKLNEFHIIKAVVLSIVTLVILLSICKMVFGMILKYPGKTDK